MKKTYSLLTIMLFAIAINAQSLNIHMNNGNTTNFVIADIDSITFTYANNEPEYLTVSIVNNALNGNTNDIAAQISLEPGIYEVSVKSANARYGSGQDPWEGIVLYTGLTTGSGPAPNMVTTLNGIGNIKTLDYSNRTTNALLNAFFIPNVPTSDDSGENVILIKNTSTGETSELSVSIVNNALNGNVNDFATQI